MTSLVEFLNNHSQTWFAIMRDVVIQSFFVFAFATIVSWMLRNWSASVRFWLWQVAAMKLLLVPLSLVVVLPLWTADSPPEQHFEFTATSVDRRAVSVPLDAPIQATLRPTGVESRPRMESTSWIFTAWVGVVLLQIGRCIRRRNALSRLIQRSQPASDEEQLRLNQLATKLNLSRQVQLRICDDVAPFVTGIFQPTVFLPQGHGFDAERFDQVVLHELAHVKRNDLFWVWIPEWTRMLLFFHPLAHWMSHRANICREVACDECVLSAGSDRQTYAQTLLQLSTVRA